MYYTFGSAKSAESLQSDTVKLRSTPVSISMVIAGLTGLIFGGQWIVAGAVKIAELFGMSQSLTGLTVFAIGTLLPVCCC